MKKKLLFFAGVLPVVSMLVLASPCFAEQLVYEKFGSSGTGYGQFQHPIGIAIDSSGNIYVTDFENDRIQKFDANGKFITTWGSEGTGNGQFSHPRGIAIDSSGNVFVADTSNDRIQKFDSNGNFISSFGSSGTGSGQLDAPSGIALFDGDIGIFVSELNNNRIQVFDSDGTSVTTLGSYGTGDYNFHSPNGIAVDSLHNFYVADSANHRIQKFDSNGNFSNTIGSYGTGYGQFDSPTGIAVDSSDNVYVTDTWNNRIQKFDSNGNFISSLGSRVQFYMPYGIAVDSSGTIYVVDRWNHRIQKITRMYVCDNIVIHPGETASFTASLHEGHDTIWDFGDNSPLIFNTNAPYHVYTDPGVYTVKYHLLMDGRYAYTESLTVTVNPLPVAVLPAFCFGIVEESIALDVSGSYDPDGRPITSYEWNYGDGTEVTTSMNHSYSSAGTYTVQLRVKNDRDDWSAWTSSTLYVLVSTAADDDRDGIPNGWEIAHNTIPVRNDSSVDKDNDGVDNLAEYTNSTDPNDSDSDNDGMTDGYEITYNLNPLSDDSSNDDDNDGLSNGEEAIYGSDPFDVDTDNDGKSDSVEVMSGSDPLDPLSYFEVTTFKMFSEYLDAYIPVIAWSSAPDIVYTIWVKIDGGDYVVLYDDFVATDMESFCIDQGNDTILNPLSDDRSRLYKVTVKE